MLCLGLLLAFLAVWGLIAVWAVMHGDPSKGRPHSQYLDITRGRGCVSNVLYFVTHL